MPARNQALRRMILSLPEKLKAVKDNMRPLVLIVTMYLAMLLATMYLSSTSLCDAFVRQAQLLVLGRVFIEPSY